MRPRSETVARWAASVVCGALILCCRQLHEGATEAQSRLARERQQLAALARLQSRIDLNHRPELDQLVELRGLFGDAEVRWTRRDGCAFLTFDEPSRAAGREAVAIEVVR